MCWEDVKIGRASSAVTSVVTTSNGGTHQLCGLDNNRTRLILGSNTSSLLFIKAGAGADLTNFTWVLTPTRPNVVLRLEDWGEMIRWSWSCFVAADDIFVSVTDVGIREKP